MAPNFQAPRGTHDVLPGEHLWWHVVRAMEQQAVEYGWRRVQTPGFEDTALFARTAGESSDVVNKEMYTFTDRSDRSLTLRPEGTAPIARAYVEHGLFKEPQPVKAYAIAPMYRYSRPGRGRYREHWQLSLEAIGSADPAVDAEVIQYYAELLRRLGVTEWELRLNSIGDAHCDACREHFDAVKAYLDHYGVPYVLDPALVRGLDYYTRTTFEFVGPDESAQASTICGGGRYDYLVEEIGGPPTPGIGFGAGIERLMLSLELEGIRADEELLDVFFAVEQGQSAFAAVYALRKAGFS